jgi:glyoxylase-like metal-dependent hydrolase (beta-lactamase superfamily II)
MPAPSPDQVNPNAYPPLAAPLDIRQVPDSSIYYAIGHPAIPSHANEGNTSNAGFVVTADAVLVFDALGTPSLGLALLRAIAARTPAPVRYVVLSHYHADHIYGLQAFRDFAQPVILAQEKSADYLNPDDTEDESAGPRLAQRREALAPWVNAYTRIVTPDIYFADKLTIALGARRCVVRYAGPAHSQSDSMMLVSPDAVLFAGDIVQNGRIPFIGSATVSTRHWLTELAAVAAMKPRFIIPGHGQPSTDAEAAIAFTRGYLEYLRTTMGKAVAQWQDFDQAYRGTDWSSYSALPTFDAINRGNAYRVFLEMEAEAFGGTGATPKRAPGADGLR